MANGFLKLDFSNGALNRLKKTTIATIVIYILWLLKNWRRIRAICSMPSDGISSLIKNSKQLRLRSGPSFRHVFPYFMNNSEKFKEHGVFCLRVGSPFFPLSRVAITVCDLDIFKQVLHQKSFGKFRKGDSYRTAKTLIGTGLLSADDGADWRLMRDLTSMGVRLPVLEGAVKTVARVTNDMMDRWRQELNSSSNGPMGLDVYEESLRLTMDVLGEVAFSYDFGSVSATTPEDAPLYFAFQTILSTLTQRGQAHWIPGWWYYVPTATNRDFNSCISKLDSICTGLVNERRKGMRNGSVSNDILETLLATDAEGHQKLNDKHIVDSMKTLLFAGHDTTASALTWALFLLASHPEKQNSLRLSLSEAGFGPRKDLPTEVTYARLDEQRLLTAVVRETLRLYPSAGFTREPRQPTTLKTSSGKEYEVFPGTEIFFFPNSVQNDPKILKDPHKFEPERWLEADAASKLPYVPFSIGPRNCVGERLATTELRISLALLITNFEFTVPAGSEEPFQILLLSMQPHGVNLKITPIE
eukprot:gnl/MRDRNA2_/MRDRNA2_14252_c0_seq1.p1 gnl/MRDRNA2_/MRDRNA2_14252_c0~~gnl/MRDRNA2_/MRDRNA2_14252_c0_seq1.p1  ORF type:complete len:529 (-),score=82.19 gnl/MRDRNA2_/MRDRNA2_14252_c0_seq1:18-1604(-)